MGTKNLITLVLKETDLTQKDLAKKVNVSPAQISKWKSGEHISFDMEKKLTDLSNIGDRNPDVVFWTGGNAEADKWGRLIAHLANFAADTSECSHVTDPLKDELGLLTCHVLHTLIEAGAEIPKTFPEALEFDYESTLEDEIEDEKRCALLYQTNPYSSLILQGLIALAHHYDFYQAYMSELFVHAELDLYSTKAANIESCLLELALAKVGQDNSLLPDFAKFRYRTYQNYQEWIEELKEKAISKGVPLKAELMLLLSEDHHSLLHEAEREAFGFNSGKLHPDIYMDEILRSHRVIHQVLPVICKKLGITEKELTFDENELRL